MISTLGSGVSSLDFRSALNVYPPHVEGTKAYEPCHKLPTITDFGFRYIRDCNTKTVFFYW